MSTSTQDRAPQQSTTSSTSNESRPSSSSASGATRQSLVGQSLDVQLQTLTPVQREGDAGVHEAAAAGIASGGGAMPFAAQIQQSFGGHDVSGVQAHTGANAVQASAAMGAEAYATGNHVVFGGAPDLHTAAHEAAHVVQQKAGVALSGGVGQSGDKYEQHADQVADAVVQGKSAEPILSQMTGGGGGGAATQRRAVQRVTAVQRNPTSGGTVTPGRTAETPGTDVVPNGGTAVTTANETRTGPKVAWRKNVDSRGNIAWFVVLEETTTTAPTSGSGGTGGTTTVDVHPDQAFSLAQNPVAEASADTFEQAVGNHACGDDTAKGAAGALAGKAIAMADAYLSAMKKASATQEQMDTSFQAILGGSGRTWAGSAAVEIPKDATNKAELAAANVERIRAAASSGNLREMVNLGVSFMYQFGPQCISDLNSKAVEIETFYAEAEKARGDLTTGNADFITNLEKQITERKEDTTWLGVVNDNKTVSTGQNSSRTKANLGGEQEQSQRQVGSLGEYATLSENEKLVMFGDSASKEKALKEKHLTWSEGRKVWFINEADAFVQKCREASIPLGGGISGTTGRIMELSNVFQTGVSATNMRAAAIGYLLPIRAHTLIEIMKGAEPFGAGAVPSPPSYAIYANIAPFGALTSLHPNETFTRLVQQTQTKSD